MSETIIPGWIHAQGKHCASTAISNAMRYWGFDFSEAFCAGLGAAPCTYYLKLPGTSPTKLVYTRSPALEETFFKALGLPFRWRTHSTPQALTDDEKTLIRDGVPLMLRLDLKYLEYYKTSTSFSGHIVLNWGFDDEAVFYGDTHFEGLQRVPLESTRLARHAKGVPVNLNGEWIPFERPNPRPLAEAIPAGLLVAARQNLQSGGADFGIAGIRTLAGDLEAWADAPDWQWCMRFTYQVIEKRGTGGGGFRLLYAQFLDEASKIRPDLVNADDVSLMFAIADKWSKASALFKRESEKEAPNGLRDISAALLEIADAEEKVYGRIMSRLE